MFHNITFADALLWQEHAQLLPLFTSNAEIIWTRLFYAEYVKSRLNNSWNSV